MSKTKDSYYFSHDSNAKDDPKCVLLIDQLGLEGYGIFWVLVETLRDQPCYEYPVNLLPALARRYLTTAEKMLAVVKSYELFTIKEDKVFFSESLIKRMLPLEEKRKKAKNAADIRWSNANALQTHSKCNTSAMLSKVKKSKGEEIKNKESTNVDIKKEKLEKEKLIDSETQFGKYMIWQKANCPYVSLMEKQLTEMEFTKLVDSFSANQVKAVIQNMENSKGSNNKPVNKRYVSVYATALNWLKRNAK